MLPPQWRIQWKQVETEKATTSSGLEFRAAHEGDICRAEVPTCWSLVGSGGLDRDSRPHMFPYNTVDPMSLSIPMGPINKQQVNGNPVSKSTLKPTVLKL